MVYFGLRDSAQNARDSMISLPEDVRNCRAVAIGVFDGVHLGHQAILRRLREIDPDHGLVLTFYPHPDAVLWDRQVHWIATPKERHALLLQGGASRVVDIPFTRELASVDAEVFAEDLFLGQLGGPAVVLGYDQCFGRGARGNARWLDECYGDRIRVERIGAVLHEDKPVSSTRVREAVLMGELDRAALMLGRAFSLHGTVIEGFKRGRQLGFPTANLAVEPAQLLPPFGVYAVRVGGVEGLLRAVANLGVRPTFEDDGSPLIEVHIPGFDGDLYGADLEIHWDRMIRPEKRFSSKEELIQQIRTDVAEALDVTA